MAGAGVASGSTNALLTAGVDPKVAQLLGMGFGFATATLLAGINYKVWDNKLNEPHAFQYKEAYKRRVFTLQEKSEGLDIKVGKADTDALRSKWNIPDEKETLAVGKTNVKGLERETFEGGSIEVRRQAGLPDLDDIYGFAQEMCLLDILADQNNPIKDFEVQLILKTVLGTLPSDEREIIIDKLDGETVRQIAKKRNKQMKEVRQTIEALRPLIVSSLYE